MRHKIWIFLIIMSFAFSAFAAKSKIINSESKNTVTDKWNPTCNGLLDTAVASTLKLEKTLNKKKKKLSQAKFNEKIQNELMVVQLNAWVCAVSSDQRLAASIEKAFLQEYAQRVQNN